jgi:hypothetical protein
MTPAQSLRTHSLKPHNLPLMPSRARFVRIVKLARRQFVKSAALAAPLAALSRLAPAQAYPSRPVRLIYGFPAGGANDILARLIGQWLSERLGQPFVVENRPGAASNIATEIAVRAPADGYTLVMLTVTHAIPGCEYHPRAFGDGRESLVSGKYRP